MVRVTHAPTLPCYGQVNLWRLGSLASRHLFGPEHPIVHFLVADLCQIPHWAIGSRSPYRIESTLIKLPPPKPPRAVCYILEVAGLTRRIAKGNSGGKAFWLPRLMEARKERWAWQITQKSVDLKEVGPRYIGDQIPLHMRKNAGVNQQSFGKQHGPRPRQCARQWTNKGPTAPVPEDESARNRC